MLIHYITAFACLTFLRFSFYPLTSKMSGGKGKHQKTLTFFPILFSGVSVKAEHKKGLLRCFARGSVNQTYNKPITNLKQIFDLLRQRSNKNYVFVSQGFCLFLFSNKTKSFVRSTRVCYRFVTDLPVSSFNKRRNARIIKSDFW